LLRRVRRSLTFTSVRLAPGPGSGFARGATAAPRSAMNGATSLRARHGACAGRGCARARAGRKENTLLKSKRSQSLARRSLLAARAWENRHAPSEPEAKLWRELSAGKLGTSFRRQVVLGNFIADFFAPSLRLVVEVDGAHHRQRASADARRDRDLRRLGCEVLRIEAQIVLQQLPRAVALVREAVERLRRGA